MNKMSKEDWKDLEEIANEEPYIDTKGRYGEKGSEQYGSDVLLARAVLELKKKVDDRI